MLWTGDTAFSVQGSWTLPPVHTEFAGHCKHAPQLIPENPGRHLHSVISEEPGGDTELAGQAVTNPLKHISPWTHGSHLLPVALSPAYMYPGLHLQASTVLEPTGDV